jgi:signal transduction histidine kinase/putative methionine-R-sulfoxide reductase with GAF domain
MSDAVADLNLVIRVQQKMREMEGALSGGQRGASADSNLEKAVELIRDDFSYDHVNLFVLDKHNRELIYTAAACARGKELVRSGYCVSVVDQDSIIGQVARTGQPYVANDVRKDLHYLLHQAFPDTRAELAVPIKVRDRLYGVLDIQVQDAVYFLEQEIKAVEILSNHIGWVVDSAQQYDHIGWLNSSIEKIADPIFTQGHLDETLQEIADSALEELKADLVILYSNDPGAGDGVSGPIYSGDLLHPELINAGPVDPDNVVFRLITSDERIYVNEDLDKIDLNSYPLFRPSATHVSTGKLTFIEREAIKANVIIRLLSNGQCVGILFLNFRQPRLYTEWEIQRYHSFAHLAALAIQKMQLQQHVIQKEKNELANLVHDILIGDTLGLFKILRAIELPAPAGTDNGASQRLELAIDATEHLHNDIRWINRLLKDDHSDDLMLEIDRLFMMFRQVFNVKTETRWSGDTRLIPRELTRELFIVISEALTNAVRHGKAKNIVVAGAVRGKHLSATIGDDGVGFNPKHVKRMNGLLSMKYRIEEMGGKFKLTSDLGRGTKIALRVPIQR